MNKKIVGLVFFIIGLIALIGAGVFVYIIAEFSTAVGALSTADTEVLGQFGVDASQMTTVLETVQTIITVGSVWLITVILSALFAMYTGIKMLLKKKK